MITLWLNAPDTETIALSFLKLEWLVTQGFLYWDTGRANLTHRGLAYRRRGV